MEEHDASVSLSGSANSNKGYREEFNKYKKEIDEILRKESENGLAKTQCSLMKIWYQIAQI